MSFKVFYSLATFILFVSDLRMLCAFEWWQPLLLLATVEDFLTLVYPLNNLTGNAYHAD